MDKSQKYLELIEDLKKLANEPVVLIDEAAVDGEIVQKMREMRQFIERFRRLKDGEDNRTEPKLDDIKIELLGRDELVFIVKAFWGWFDSEKCPREKCEDYFCRYCQKRKEEADEELADGEMEPDDYNRLAGQGFYDGDCEDFAQECCWGRFYLWCYRNGYDPETGKKVAK